MSAVTGSCSESSAQTLFCQSDSNFRHVKLL